jgi:hypothetical protein
MRILIRSNSYEGPAVVTLLVNGSPTLFSTTIPAGSTQDIDIAGGVDVFDSDRISVALDEPTEPAGLIDLIVSYEIK